LLEGLAGVEALKNVSGEDSTGDNDSRDTRLKN